MLGILKSTKDTGEEPGQPWLTHIQGRHKDRPSSSHKTGQPSLRAVGSDLASNQVSRWLCTHENLFCPHISRDSTPREGHKRQEVLSKKKELTAEVEFQPCDLGSLLPICKMGIVTVLT